MIVSTKLTEIAMLRSFALTLMLICAPGLNAQILDYDRGKPKIYNPSNLDMQYMEQVKDSVEDIAERFLGRRFVGARDHDLELMQTLLDKKLIARDQTQRLQGLGYILGDLLAKEENLKWVIYEDSMGRSRALSIPGKPDVVFPVTMISRRYEVGIDVNVREIYEKAKQSTAFIREKIYIR